MKIKLEKSRPYPWLAPEVGVSSITYSLPFYKSRKGKYIHRVRSADVHWWNGEVQHVSIHFWCGSYGFLNGKGMLIDSAPINEPVCATCEGRAIGAGTDGAPIINGRLVKFSPREKQKAQSND